jgi:hypothetical protein
MGYSVRLPRDHAAQIAVMGVTAALVMERGLEQAFGPYSGNGILDFDLVSGTPLLLDVTTNIPANIANHNPMAILSSVDANDETIQPPFAAQGTVNASDITYPIRRFERQNMNFIFMVQDAENTGDEQTFFIRGNITDPTNQLGTTETVTLIETPGMTSPGANSPAQVTFSWTHDSAIDGQGFTMIDIKDATTQKTVWSVIVEASIDTVVLPALPGSLSANELQSTQQYTWDAAALTVTNLDFNNFQIGMFDDLGLVVKAGRDVRMATTDSQTVTIN